MSNTTCRARRLACATIAVLASLAAPATADDRPLIWAPAKLSQNAYGVTMGVRLPAPVDASVGAEVAVRADEAGRIKPGGTPVKLWGMLAAGSGSGSARAVQRDIKLQFDAVTGAGTVDASNVGRWIVTPDFDFESRRALAIGCNSYERHCSGFNASQTARLLATRTGTAVVAQGTVVGVRARLRSRVAIEQKVWNSIDFGASISDPLSAPVGAVTARYALNW